MYVVLLAAIKKDQIGFFVTNDIAIDIIQCDYDIIILWDEDECVVNLSAKGEEGQVTPVIGLVSHVLLAHFVNGEKWVQSSGFIIIFKDNSYRWVVVAIKKPRLLFLLTIITIKMTHNVTVVFRFPWPWFNAPPYVAFPCSSTSPLVFPKIIRCWCLSEESSQGRQHRGFPSF